SQMLPASPDAPTPPNLGRADTFNSLDLSSISKQITGQSQVIMVQQGPSRKSMVMAIIAVAIIATVVTVITVTMVGNKPEDTTAPTGEKSGPDKDALSSTLDRVDQLITDGKWGKAESMLDSVVNDIGDFPDLVERAADYRDNIAIGRLLVKANGLRDGGDLVAAIQTYESVLARDPNNATAKEELKAAREKASASNLAGTLSLTGNKNGTVFI